ncbi:hypothetical protein [Nostoc sp.]|uniref:hypothetical protein n=1 Tax=Nostoc sp. TaxID=1180 RepID=UPI002FFB02F8
MGWAIREPVAQGGQDFPAGRYANGVSATSLLRLRQRQRYFDVAQYKSVQVSRTLPTPQDWIIYLVGSSLEGNPRVTVHANLHKIMSND